MRFKFFIALRYYASDLTADQILPISKESKAQREDREEKAKKEQEKKVDVNASALPTDLEWLGRRAQRAFLHPVLRAALLRILAVAHRGFRESVRSKAKIQQEKMLEDKKEDGDDAPDCVGIAEKLAQLPIPGLCQTPARHNNGDDAGTTTRKCETGNGREPVTRSTFRNET
jgi:hypothetical protein